MTKPAAFRQRFAGLPAARIAIEAGTHSPWANALLRVLSSDPDQRMPPPEAGDALPTAAITMLRTWIEAGAPWGERAG